MASCIGEPEGGMSGDPEDVFPDRWLAVSCRLPPAGEELFAAESLAALGGTAVQPEGGRLVAHFTPPGQGGDDEAAARMAREVEARLQAATSLSEPDVRWWWIAGEEGLEAMSLTRADDRIPISPTLVVERSDEAGSAVGPGASGTPRVLRLLPGLGFGDAEHPTTRAALLQVERLVSPGERVLDLGAGSGILAVAAALLGAGSVLAVERDPYACRAARRNAAANGVGERVEVSRETAEAGSLRGRGPFDGVAANLVPGVLLPLLPDLVAELRDGGWLVLAGVPAGERGGVLSAAEAAGLTLEGERTDQGWWSGRLRAGKGAAP